MADYEELFLLDSADKQMTIESDDGTVRITNKELHGEQFELKESLCSEKQLRFGCCETSSIKFKISYVRTSMKGKWLTVKTSIKGNEPYQIGRYKVFSDVPTADRQFREVLAYDAMYDIINSDVAEWYNTILPTDESTVSLKAFRDSFFQHFGITQETIPLPQDVLTVQKTIDPTEISGKDIITKICEINGCFGHIGRDGKFQYIFLKELIEGLYPRDDLFPRDDIYPADPMNSARIDRAYYISAKYEDFKTKKIDKLQIRQNENDIGCIYGTGNNTYIVEDNFLVYGKNASELEHIAEVLYEQIYRISYRPASVRAKGNPTLSVGDGIRLRTKYEIIYTYVLERTLKGIQALFDDYNAQGEENYNSQVNSVNKSIIQLRGKTNELTRNVDETNSRLTDTANGLQSQITQNANSITAEVTRATTAEGNLSASITINANAISQRVVKGTISSEISQEAGKISIKANRISITSSYFTLTEDGHITATGGTIGGATISNNSIYASNGNWSINSNGSATFKNVTITGVQRGSTFGSIGYNSSGVTYGNFGGASYFSPTVSNPFGGQAVTQIESLAVNKLYAEYIQGMQADISSIQSDYITTGELNAVSARVGTIESDYVITSELNAVNAKFNHLNASNIDSGTLSTDYLIKNGNAIGVGSGYLFYQVPIIKTTKNASGYVTDVSLDLGSYGYFNYLGYGGHDV